MPHISRAVESYPYRNLLREYRETLKNGRGGHAGIRRCAWRLARCPKKNFWLPSSHLPAARGAHRRLNLKNNRVPWRLLSSMKTAGVFTFRIRVQLNGLQDSSG